MKNILGLIRAEPVSFNGIVVAATGLAILLGLDEKVGGGIAVFIGAVVTWLVRANVNTVSKTVAVVNAAASGAATSTAKRLTDQTVGPLGEVADTAVGIAAGAATDAADLVLKEAGFSRSDIKQSG